MKNALCASLLAILACQTDAAAQLLGSTAPDSLSFQGYLTDAVGDPITGPTNLTFKLYKNGAEVWSQTKSGVPVADGVFSVILGGTGAASLDTVAFNEPIEVGVSVGADPEMVPRTPLTAAAYALGIRGLHAVAANDGTNEAPNLIGGAANNMVADGVVGAVIAGGGGSELGETVSNSVLEDWGTVSGGNDNAAGEVGATVSGGLRNEANGYASAVSGGELNSVAGSYSVIVGGSDNTTQGSYSIIGGGFSNYVAGNSSVIGGGQDNSAPAFGTVVSGGVENYAGGQGGFVGGGFGNHANGRYSVVPGGEANRATESFSFAAGLKARASHAGSFVWADSTGSSGTIFETTADNQFIVRAGGGVGIGTNKPKRGLTISRDAEEAAYQLELRNVGDIHGGYFSGIAFTQTDSGATESASIKVIYHSNGKPDMSFSVRDATDALFIKSITGNIGIGTTTPATELEVVGVITETSDARFKRDVSPIRNAMSRVEGLRGVTFEWDQEAWPDRGFSSGRQMGLIAQEVDEVVPEVVRQGEDGHYAVAYSNLVPLLIEAMKEQQATIEAQNERIAELERRLVP